MYLCIYILCQRAYTHFWLDVEEGVGNSHPSHALPNSTHGEEGGDSGGGEIEGEKSVLQAKLTNLAIQENNQIHAVQQEARPKKINIK